VIILETIVAEQQKEIADLRADLDAERVARRSITFDLQGNDVAEGTARLAVVDELELITGVLSVIQPIAIPNLIGARKGSNEAAAIGSLRTINTAQSLFREGDKDMNGILDYADSLSDLSETNLIDSTLGTGTKQGYLFAIASASQSAYTATACPVTQGVTGDRSFFVDQSGVIRFSLSCPAGPNDTPVP
jgi:hypothetical protein